MRRIWFVWLWVVFAAMVLCGCSGENVSTQSKDAALQWDEMTVDHSLELAYADQFSVDYYEGGYALLTIGREQRFLVVPEGAEVPGGLEEDIGVLQQPLDQIYLVATSAMDLFRELDGIGNVTLSGAKEEDWYIEEAREAMEAGKLVYAGKYNVPDYELILSKGCDLAIESTMIEHTPEVKEQLERFGIPVLVERSSYESHPLGRMEWLKLYGVLLDREEEAQAYFDELMTKMDAITAQENTGKTVAFFYIHSSGGVNVRKSEDYVAKAIEMAGGSYIFSDLTEEENALSTMNIQMETFYNQAKEADVLIYNSAIDGELTTMEQLLEKSELLADFKAVQNGNVWCTGQNLFQESLGLGDLIEDIHTILTQPDPPEDLAYLHRLR